MEKLPKIEAMLERQQRFWEMRRRLTGEAGERAARELGSPAEGPWITVSRQRGSGGIELARRLAHELGWQAFDREILTTIAEHTHTRESVLSRLDESAIGPINDYISSLLDPQIPGRTPFVQEMVKVVWGLAKQGNAIIVGRGANWFLESRYGLRVRTVAPRDFRAATLARQEGIPEAEALRQIDEDDSRREGFVRQVFGRAIDNPAGYDLVLNLGEVDFETALQICKVGLRGRLARTASL